MIYVILLSTMAISIFNLKLGWILYLGIVIFIESAKILLIFMGNEKDFDVFNGHKVTWNDKEKDYLKKYYIFFRFPASSKVHSSRFSFIALLSFVWVPWLLFNKAWIIAGLIGLNYILAQMISVKLNPVHYMVEMIAKESARGTVTGIQAQKDLIIITGIIDKLYGYSNGDAYYSTVTLKDTEEYQIASESQIKT